MDHLDVLSGSCRFMAKTRSRHRALDTLLSRLCEIGDPLLFGGAVRDIALYQDDAKPRDFDFAIDGVDTDQLEWFLLQNGWIYRKNKFGGFKLSLEGYKVDIWPLATTWAFRRKLVAGSIPANLPCTVFLNVDAVAVSLRHQRLFESGFVNGLKHRIIDIVLPDNPMPALNIMRALVLQERLGSRLSRKLREYIGHWSRAQLNPLQTLRNLQRHRYGHASITAAAFDQAMHLATETV